MRDGGSVLLQQRTKGTDYVVRLDNFEGPLDLLLHLIERRELEITSISIAQVTDQYLTYIEQAAGDVDPAKLADFVALAARLLVIKSRVLLPQPPAADEEEEEDPGESLARQLRLYKVTRDVARWLSAREETGLRGYVRVAPMPEGNTRLEPGAITLDDLVRAFREVLLRRGEARWDAAVLTPYPVTVQEKLEALRAELRQRRRLEFREILLRSRHRKEIVVTFLAVLELLRLGEVEATQEDLFGPIIITVASASDQAATSE